MLNTISGGPMKHIHFMPLLIMSLLCVGVAAQQTKHKDAKKASTKSEMPAGMPMPKPSPQIEKLADKIVGTWNTSEDFEVSEMMPKGGKSVWCDNTSPNGCSASNGLGKWEGNDVVFNDEQEMMGKKMAMKEVYTDMKPSSFTMTMDGSQDGGPMKRQMTIKYTKAGAKAMKTTASAQ